jgi:hypothetical protein
VGRNYGQITNSYVTGDVTGRDEVGGWWAELWFITESYAVGNVEGLERVGGLVGINYDEGNIDKSYATGTVTGTETGINYTYVGGLVGSNITVRLAILMPEEPYPDRKTLAAW